MAGCLEGVQRCQHLDHGHQACASRREEFLVCLFLGLLIFLEGGGTKRVIILLQQPRDTNKTSYSYLAISSSIITTSV